MRVVLVWRSGAQALALSLVQLFPLALLPNLGITAKKMANAHHFNVSDAPEAHKACCNIPVTLIARSMFTLHSTQVLGSHSTRPDKKKENGLCERKAPDILSLERIHTSAGMWIRPRKASFETCLNGRRIMWLAERYSTSVPCLVLRLPDSA
jgi:hypothetical protein